MFGVQSLVFNKFLRLNIPDYYLFLLGGLLPWIFFSQTVLMGSPVFVSQSQLLRSFKVNPLVILSSQVLDNFINFLASFFLILIPFYIFKDKSLLPLTLIPMALIPLLLGTFSLTVALGLSNVFFRDTNFVIGFIFSLLFFLTPIFYPREYVPADWQWLTDINPVTYLIDPFRVLIYDPKFSIFIPSFLKSLGVSLIISVIAVLFWKRKQNDFYRKL
jgi:ABC-type polysaccharide/polyol phosphate export permease